MTKQRTCPHCGKRLKVPGLADMQDRNVDTDFFCSGCGRNYAVGESPSGLVCVECGRPEAAT